MGWKRLVAGLFTSAMLIAGCGDDASDSGSSGAEEKKITSSKVIDAGVDGQRQGRRHVLHRQGHIGDLKEGITEFNKANPGLNAKLVEFPESADEQRKQFVQRQQAKSSDCDVF